MIAFPLFIALPQKDMTWWELGYIDNAEKVLMLWQDLGQEHPVTGEDMNPKREVPWPTDVAMMRDIRAAHMIHRNVECYVPKDMDIVTAWRVQG